jgi:hypothetical protein
MPITVSDTEADELVAAVINFQRSAENWIRSKYKTLA